MRKGKVGVSQGPVDVIHSLYICICRKDTPSDTLDGMFWNLPLNAIVLFHNYYGIHNKMIYNN